MTVLAGFSSWHETIALQSGRNWPRACIQHSLKELTNAIRFAADPTCRTRRHMALDAFHPGMGRVLIGRQLGIHRVTGCSAELWCLHMLDGAIGKLSSKQDVQESCGAEEPRDTTQCVLAIEAFLSYLSANLAFPQVDTDRN